MTGAQQATSVFTSLKNSSMTQSRVKNREKFTQLLKKASAEIYHQFAFGKERIIELLKYCALRALVMLLSKT